MTQLKMTKATPALRNVRPTYPGQRNEGPKRLQHKEGWAQAQIRIAVEALHRDGAPLGALTNSQIASRCANWMRKRQRKLDAEIPRPRSFERHLPPFWLRSSSAARSDDLAKSGDLRWRATETKLAQVCEADWRGCVKTCLRALR